MCLHFGAAAGVYSRMAFRYNKQSFRDYIRRNEMIRRIALAFLVALLAAGLAGCNTVKGVGKDIESGGKAIERSSGK